MRPKQFQAAWSRSGNKSSNIRAINANPDAFAKAVDQQEIIERLEMNLSGVIKNVSGIEKEFQTRLPLNLDRFKKTEGPPGGIERRSSSGRRFYVSEHNGSQSQ